MLYLGSEALRCTYQSRSWFQAIFFRRLSEVENKLYIVEINCTYWTWKWSRQQCHPFFINFWCMTPAVMQWHLCDADVHCTAAVSNWTGAIEQVLSIISAAAVSGEDEKQVMLLFLDAFIAPGSNSLCYPLRQEGDGVCRVLFNRGQVENCFVCNAVCRVRCQTQASKW